MIAGQGTAAIVMSADVPPLLPCGACRQPLPVSGPDACAWGLTAQASSLTGGIPPDGGGMALL